MKHTKLAIDDRKAVFDDWIDVSGYWADSLSAQRQATVSTPPPLVFEESDENISGNEVDVYATNLIAGQTYIFSARGLGVNPLIDPYLYIIDSSRTEAGILADDDDGGNALNSLITYTATYTGVHYIGVGAFPGSGLTGSFIVDEFANPGVDLVPDTFAAGVNLSLNSISFGAIEPAASSPYGPGFSEVDTYKVQVQAGKLYTIEMAGGADYASPSPLPAGEIDSQLTVYNSSFRFVTENDDISASDPSARVSFTAATTGTFYVDAYAEAGQTGAYSLTVREYDVLNGTSANNTLNGGVANDAINGLGGRDTINGGAGNDLLSGGGGNDRFVFSDLGGRDEITDFRRGSDKIDVSALGDFTYVGSNAFSGGSDGAELRGYSWQGGFYLSGDANGDGLGDFLIEVDNTIILGSSDLILG